jgi:hypothetical protein
VESQAENLSKIVGHAHVVIQKMDSISSAKLLDPNTFAFFKGFDFADGEFIHI